jgi:hypothetical protein
VNFNAKNGESDYENVLIKWWSDWVLRKLHLKIFLSDYGLIVYDGIFCAGYIYLTNSSSLIVVGLANKARKNHMMYTHSMN